LRAYICLLKPCGQLVVQHEDDFEAPAMKNWTSSTTGIQLPMALKQTRELEKHRLQWESAMHRALTPEQFLERVTNGLEEDIAVTAKTGIGRLPSRIVKPYVIDGLVEW
jgi:hypothetical protein